MSGTRPWRRRQRVSPQVREAVALAPLERVLAVASAEDGGHVVATDRALYGVSPDPRPELTVRMRWDLIDKAIWDPPVVAIDYRDTPETAVKRVSFVLPTDVELPAVVRERVTNSIVVNSRIDVVGGSARVLARRNTEDGRVSWRVVHSAAVDPEDQSVRAATEAELRDLRSRLGI